MVCCLFFGGFSAHTVSVELGNIDDGQFGLSCLTVILASPLVVPSYPSKKLGLGPGREEGIDASFSVSIKIIKRFSP
jgi:hypothetical protein